jgi:hypothetical protein
MGGLYFAASAALLPVRQETLATPRIFAYRGWQSVGVRLAAGDLVTIRAEGEWLYTPGDYHGPAGHARYAAPAFYPLPGVPGGALIARIGETGSPVYVGAQARLHAATPGTLYLRIDDDILSDNQGWVDVHVTREPAAAQQ